MKSPKTSIHQLPCRDDFLRDVVKQLIHHRHRLSLTQEQVDGIMGNTDRHVSKWECGLRTPTAFNLYCWVDALNCQLSIKAWQE